MIEFCHANRIRNAAFASLRIHSNDCGFFILPTNGYCFRFIRSLLLLLQYSVLHLFYISRKRDRSDLSSLLIKNSLFLVEVQTRCVKRNIPLFTAILVDNFLSGIIRAILDEINIQSFSFHLRQICQIIIVVIRKAGAKCPVREVNRSENRLLVHSGYQIIRFIPIQQRAHKHIPAIDNHLQPQFFD